jgi:hypothetical protein
MRKKLSILFLIIFVLTIISVTVLKMQIDQLNGSALSGHRSDGKYFIMTYELTYVEVSKFEWYTDFIIWVITLVFWVLSGIGLIFFVSAYGFPFTFKVARMWKDLSSKICQKLRNR